MTSQVPVKSGKEVVLRELKKWQSHTENGNMPVHQGMELSTFQE